MAILHWKQGLLCDKNKVSSDFNVNKAERLKYVNHVWKINSLT